MAEVTKSILRKVYLEKRKKLSEEEFQKRNYLIHNWSINYIFEKGFKNIHLFLPIRRQREINCFPLIQTLLREKPDIKIVSSRTDLKSDKLWHYEINTNSKFQLNKWGIPEPLKGKEFPIDELDAIFVPLVTATKDGHRIGYGKGYYDTFLKGCKPTVEKIGLSIAPPLDKISIFEEHDVCLNSLITPFQHIHF